VRLIVSSAASADVDRLYHFLADKDVASAQRIVTVIDGAMRSLLIFPDRGRPSGITGIRELIVPFGGSSYVLRYAHSAHHDAIIVLRICMAGNSVSNIDTLTHAARH
jgi:plasmid stabilization system protein ParE